MRKANLNSHNAAIAVRLAEARMNPYDRERALHVLESAQKVADALIWARDKIATLGAYFLNPGFKH